MCGRISIWDLKQLDKEYGPWKKQDKNQIPLLKPHYNGSPSQYLPVKTEDGLELMRWGLVPSWSKTFSTSFSTINARAEGIEKSRLYGRLLKTHRCIVPVNSFFEWKHGEGKTKIPMLIKDKKRSLIGLAGLWDHWFDAEKKEFKTFTILTTRPNAFMSSIHERMPVILEKDEEKPWLEEKEYVDFKQVLDPYPENQLIAYPVSSLVNKPSHDNAQVIDILQ